MRIRINVGSVAGNNDVRSSSPAADTSVEGDNGVDSSTPGAATSGESVQFSLGIGCVPHIFVVDSGEDITRIITSLYEEGNRSIYVSSANGLVSTITIRNGEVTNTYEGLFEIGSLSGFFIPKDIGGGRTERNGGVSIIFSDADGGTRGGVVAGPVIAASPLTVTVTSFQAATAYDISNVETQNGGQP